MRALIVSDRLTYREDYPMPDPPPGEALIRVTRGGICNTDIEILKGYFGFRGVLGHEFVGVVEALNPLPGSAPHVSVGDRVVGEINCVPCDSPSRNAFERAQDPARSTLGIDCRDGAFADYTVLPIVNLHRVPDGVDDDEAVFTEPLAAACQILEQVHIRPTDRVAVLGDGKLGLLCAQVIAAGAPCELTVIGKHATKLEVARRRGIRTTCVEAAPLRAFDVVVECTGSPAGFEHARQLIVVDEITVVGSRCGPFAAALRLLEQKRVDVRPLIHARYPLSQGDAAIEHAQRPGVLKVLLDLT